MLYEILIRPLELLLELLFSISYHLIGSYGTAIIIMSIVINSLIIPLYKRADAIQVEEEKKRKKLNKWVTHIKNTFKGDERFLMLQTYYRQNAYKPVYVLRGSISLLLQIPFFIAGYHFLSNLECLQGVSYGFISDLGSPDKLIHWGVHSINLLPLLMTGINIISCIIYTKGKTSSIKLQLYLTAIVFLVLLYNSPSGLVFYWLCNNVYSGIKNLVFSKKKTEVKSIDRDKDNIRSLFVLSNVFLCILVGILIPSVIIKSSPQEFMSTEYYLNPINYIIYTFEISFGVFIVWFGIYYYLANNKKRRVFNEVAFILALCALVNYLYFGNKLGNLSSILKYDNYIQFSLKDYVINIIILLLICIFEHFIIKKVSIINIVIIAGIITVTLFSGNNIYIINKHENIYFDLTQRDFSDVNIPLSKNGKNVIVFMLDRALGAQLPYIINEKPELKEKFDGFTYYKNTLSFGNATNFGSPALYGGYEYTPEKMNERNNLSLMDKQNEALKVMPVIFDENGYSVTVGDPVYAGYKWTPDLSIYDDYPDINVFNTEKMFRKDVDENIDQAQLDHIRRRNFFCYSIVRIMPLICWNRLYDDGLYNEPDYFINDNRETTALSKKAKSYIQITDGLSKSDGYDYSSMDSYSVLTHLSNITNVNDDENNNFVLLSNSFTHNPSLLQEPDYVPALHVDNTDYDYNLSDRYIINGVKMRMDNILQVKHYQSNAAALLRLGDWFDYLKKNGVYDNTRIIIVADHGHNLDQFDLTLPDGLDIEWFLPLLLMKDFNEKEFKTSDEFMTQSDVPTMAFDGLIEHPVNPFTGKEINSIEKQKDHQNVMFSLDWSIDKNNGNTFLPGDWYSVKNNVYDLKNWKYLGHY